VSAPAAPAALPVRRVVLYKTGVGYFEHVGRVRGTQSVSIDFNTDQLNDVLKSLTILDLSDGRIANVSFNSEAPLAQRLGAQALPVGEQTTLLELLRTLRGARLEIRTARGLVTGRLVSVERRERAKDDGPARDELTVMSESGELRSVELTPAVSVKLAERDSAEQVGAYLGLLASNRAQNHRRMTIAAVGTGVRDLLVSYVSEVPVWKTTYRLVMPSKSGGKPMLQGWAIVDNTVGEDWNDVELSLVAGAPQSFIQKLSQPVYTQRSVVGMARTSLPAPQIHQEPISDKAVGLHGRVVDSSGAPVPGVAVMAIDPNRRRFDAVSDAQGRYSLSMLAAGTYRMEFALSGFKTVTIDALTLMHPGQIVPDIIMPVGALAESIRVSGETGLERYDGRPYVGVVSGGIVAGLAGGVPPPPPAAPTRAFIEERLANAQVTAQTQDLGDLFEYRVAGPITIRKNQSALVPILKTDIGIQRVSIWNERTGARPLRSLWLTNSSGLTLDAGSVTVLQDATFAGEGLIDPLKPGEQVESRRGDDRRAIMRVRIDRGVAVQHSEQRMRKVYTIHNSDVVARTVVVEHPVTPGWTLANGVEPAETSLTSYRFLVPVEAKGTATLSVEERRPTEARYTISQLTDDQIALFVRDARENVRLTQALGAIQTKKSAVATLIAEMRTRSVEATRISEDQTRLRENMRSLKGSGGERQLLERYVAQLNRQEDRVDALRREAAGLQEKLERAQAELAAMIEAVSVDVEVADGDTAQALLPNPADAKKSSPSRAQA
jgi:hypothetical protein